MFILVDLSYITSDAKLHESVAIYALRVIDGFLKNKKADIALLVSECYFDYFNKRYRQRERRLSEDSSGV